MSGLLDRWDTYPDSNMPLHVMLGVLSLTGRVEACLPGLRSRQDTAPPPLAPESADAVVSALLGVLALRRTLQGIAGTDPVPSAEGEPDVPLTTTSRDLLR